MSNPNPEPAFEIATVDRWWELTREYPAFRKLSHTPLKSFGYLRLLHYIKRHEPKRILEFGHGLGHNFESALYDPLPGVELYAVDDCQDLWYYPQAQEWEEKYNAYTARFPKVKFVRGLLGDREKTRGRIPEGHFDLICSVSVLEEMPIEVFQQVCDHCFHLLAPGGHLLFSYDIQIDRVGIIHKMWRIIRDIGFGKTLLIRKVMRSLRDIGFQANAPLTDQFRLNWEGVIRESQFVVMMYYVSKELATEDRVYPGDWTTFVADCVKPSA